MCSLTFGNVCGSGRRTRTACQTRNSAASTFFNLLVLKTGGYIDVKQEEPFGAIAVRATVGGVAPPPAGGRGLDGAGTCARR